MTLRWYATTPIYFGLVRAFGPGDHVPDSVVTAHPAETTGRVIRIDVPAQNPAVVLRPLLTSDRDTDAEREAFIPARLSDVALRSAYATYLTLAANPDTLIVGVITRDANGAATSAPVVWPDGTPGTYTADTVSAAFPGAVDAYHITFGSPASKTYTQPTVTRDPSTGAVTNRPAMTVS